MKKLLALCLTVVLLLAMMPIIGASAADSATFSVGSVTGAPGEEVTVAVSIDTNPGLTFAQVKVGYDADALELVNIQKLTFAGKLTSCSPITANPLMVTYDNCLEDITATGTLANVTFKIKDTAAEGTYALTVSADQENVFDVTFNDVPFTCENGAITVKKAAVEPPVINGLTFLAGNVSGKAGDEVSVPVSIAGNTGLTFAQVKVAYDTSVLEVVEIQKLTFAGKLTSCSPITANPLMVTYDNCLEDITDNGDLANIVFKIKDTAAEGTYALTVSADQENVFDVTFNDVPFTCINGSVTVGEGAIEPPPVDPPSGCTHEWVQEAEDEYLATEATCKEQATYYEYCLVCGVKSGNTFKVGEVNADNHAGEKTTTPAVESTCLVQGNAEYVTCNDCKKIIEGSDAKLPLGEHAWAEVVDDKYLEKAATCTAKATYYKNCSVCGEVSDKTFESGETLAHTAIQVVEDKYLATEATCEKQATYYNSCEVCGEKLNATFPYGELAEHKYGEWTTTKEPTYTEEGSREQECSVCGDKIVEKIPMLDCTHEYVEVVDDKYLEKAATCTTKATYYKSCKVCGVVSDETFEAGEFAAHTAAQVADDKYLVSEATCENQATYNTSCSVCGEKLDATFPYGELAEHKYGEWTTTKEPTTTETGSKEKECSVCGDKVIEEIPMIPTVPTEVLFVVGEVTGAPGEEVTVDVSIDDNIGLTFAQILIDYDADALEVVGITPVKFAGVETTYGPIENNPISITWYDGLKNTTENGVIATITFKIKDTAAAGSYALTVSADPDNVLDADVNNVPFKTVDGAINVCIHEWAEVVNNDYLASEATCTAKATYYKSCALCGAVSDKTFENGELLPHEAAQAVADEYLATEATCVAKATYYTSCSVCSAKLDATFESGEVNADNHAGEKTTHDAVASTCTVAGNEEYVTCDDCGVVVEGSDAKLPLAAHTYAEVVDEKYLASEATCVAKATYYKSCSACGVADTATFESGEENVDNHAGEKTTHAAVESTCTVAGNAEYVTCDDCGVIVEGSDAKLPLAAHTYAEVADEKYLASEATCVAKATYYKSCSACGVADTATFEAGEVNANNHAGEKTTHAAVESTCTVAGNAEYVTCDDCGVVVEGSDAKLPLAAHTYAEVVDDKYLASEATCVAKATYYKSCSACGVADTATFESGEVNADNHAGEKTTHAAVASTCTVAGNAEFVTCDDCGVVVEGSDAKLPLAEHTYAEVVDENYLVSDATCTAKATYYKSCSACGEASEETFETGEVLAHTWAEIVDEKYLVTAATCEAKAVYNKSCEVCSEASDETFETGELAAHELTHNEAVDAKCDAEGSVENWSCSVCEKIFSDAEAKEEITAEETVVEKVEHKYGDWKVVKEATTKEEGVKEKVCADCGEKIEEKIPVLPEKPEGDKNETSPTTSDVNIFVVASMIMALAAAAVVVLKKKA